MRLSYRVLYLFVEGPDDKRFFERIVKPEFEKDYDYVNIIQYAEMRKDKLNNFLKSINSMGADYIFFADINNSPCVSKKKDLLKSKFYSLDLNKIIIIIQEIESWYLAGLSNRSMKELGIQRSIRKSLQTTDYITKERFNELIPKKFDSRIEFMIEILNKFSIKTAKKKNKSFRYFWEKFVED